MITPTQSLFIFKLYFLIKVPYPSFTPLRPPGTHRLTTKRKEWPAGFDHQESESR